MLTAALLAPAPAAPALHRCWDPERVEHVAALADERGQADLVALCDEMLRGERSEEELPSWIEHYELEEHCDWRHVRRLRRRPRLEVTLLAEAA
jgi:hypothetical protein